MNKLSVIIPSRNGLHILKKFLPAIIRETERAGGQVTVVDDCSGDGTADEIQILFPEVTLLSRRTEPGFCHAVNLGMDKSHSNYIMLLNNDTIPEEGSFRKLVEALEQSEENVAVAVPSIVRPDGSDDSSYRWAFNHGLATTGEDTAGEEYPSGACALWKKQIWTELGGLSTLYAPIYWEDTDLGVRMHQAGYTMKRCGEIVVRHMHAATMGSSLESETLRERNRFIFMDNHCSSPAKRISRGLWMPVHLLIAFVKKNRAFTGGYRDYLKHKREQK
ncbi:MAG: glycosyltransferase family 2 protein [Candidatus Sabulitectum sp.]|nr:glycosyltransferase family 2 protein [Candidatus Sabulitectum sp.]